MRRGGPFTGLLSRIRPVLERGEFLSGTVREDR